MGNETDIEIDNLVKKKSARNVRRIYNYSQYKA